MGGGLLLLVIVVSLGLVSRYRRKFLEGKASKDVEDNNINTKTMFTITMTTIIMFTQKQ